MFCIIHLDLTSYDELSYRQPGHSLRSAIQLPAQEVNWWKFFILAVGGSSINNKASFLEEFEILFLNFSFLLL